MSSVIMFQFIDAGYYLGFQSTISLPSTVIKAINIFFTNTQQKNLPVRSHEDLARIVYESELRGYLNSIETPDITLTNNDILIVEMYTALVKLGINELFSHYSLTLKGSEISRLREIAINYATPMIDRVAAILVAHILYLQVKLNGQ